ncbi:FAD:protein FMN transferase [Dyadobacter sp. CY312]|uniref:FAD:protein FMN transferase n=1 Tax=Dyadobacter sp. CY312 TaxID=2907303 RepID=UPI001F1D09B6|nr:FAD:protein FMN transferase [Dyadobacter sp. CY312]MCE7040764.1 FAD:protein FMN transferase [Dyadobacter sp. CY312]
MSFQRLIYATFLILFLSQNRTAAQSIPMVSVNGKAQGTTYNIKYFDTEKRNFKIQIDSILTDFDKSLSLYRDDSELSLFNRSHAIKFTTPYFYPVLAKSKEVYEATNGMFDPTILPLTEAYGFGANGKNQNAKLAVDSALKLIGFNQIEFDSISVQKSKENVRLDFNGIAQGYSVDVISRFLEQKNIKCYMVEIGGEIVCKGTKNDDKPWITGIDNPLTPGSLYATVTLTDKAMTTAGNYRNHFEKDGQVFNHLINPKTGSMEQTSLLSVTVFAKDAITADAYDTAFFVMGIEETKKFIKQHKHIDVFLIYNDTTGKLSSYASEGIRNFIKIL